MQSSKLYILKSYGNRNHNDGSEDISILERSTMFFENHDHSLIIFDEITMRFLSNSEDRFLEMERHFSALKELVKFSKPHPAEKTLQRRRRQSEDSRRLLLIVPCIFPPQSYGLWVKPVLSPF